MLLCSRLDRGPPRRNIARMKGEDVRKRIVVLFIAGVAVPSGLLGYLALRGVRNDQALFELEQRERLQEAAELVLASFENRLSVLAYRTVSSDPVERREPLVEAVFDLTPEGRFAGLRSPDALYETGTRTRPAPDAALSTADEQRLVIARQRELRDDDLAGALSEYTRLLSEAASERGKAEALNGLARVSRKQGRLKAAAEYYRRLIAEPGAVRSGAGIPFALAARLELSSALEATADLDGSAREVTALLEALLATEYELSATEYGFVADGARNVAERLLTRPNDRETPGSWRDSLRSLLALEEAERIRHARIRRFVTAVSDEPDLLRNALQRSRSLGFSGSMIQGGDGPYPVYLVGEEASGGDSPTVARGLLLNAYELVQTAEAAARDAVGSLDLRWVLRDESGIVLAESPAGVEGTPMVLVDFPGRFPPLSLGLLPPATGTIQSFFTSPSSVYLYAFVLVAGVLAGGLALTVRTLSHQLELARMQSDFVSTVSHEFKSPLTAIRQHAEMLKAGRVPSEARRRRYFDVLVEQSERLTALIDHVLDFARIDAGHAELDLVEVDLEPFLLDVVSGVQERVRSQDFVVRQEIEPDLPPVTMDSEGIALALTNLIDNAIKFSGDSREVIVRCHAENDQIVIRVQDFGIGLDSSERDRVFERFYRGEDALKRAVKGTGLGLTLVKQIVEAHGGSISVDSEPGKGSTFTVRLPVSRP